MIQLIYITYNRLNKNNIESKSNFSKYISETSSQIKTHFIFLLSILIIIQLYKSQNSSMMIKFPKALQRINAQNINGISESNQIILMSIFYKPNSKDQTAKHLLALTDKFILYYHDDTKTKIKRIMKIDFNCKFQVLKNKAQQKIGLKFQKEGCRSYDLIWYELDSVDIWECQLQKRMNKRGFHEEFKPIKKIGKGNFAAVYLAIRNSDNQKVAVKAFSKQQVFAQEKGKDSLVNQIKLLRAFNHRNLLHLYAVYESNNSLYLVLQYLEGNSLFSVIQKQQFTIGQVKSIMDGLLSGVAELAKKNVVHRDLKPENIMFRTSKINSDIVILDFGLSTFANQPEYIYSRCGTPGFVAPQIVNLKDLTAKCHPIADIFSLGLIFHILLLGKSPFKGKTFNQVLSENRACNFTLIGQQYNKLPDDAYNLLKKMLEKNLNLRINAQSALKHKFFGFHQMEIQESHIQVIINPQDIKPIIGSPVIEDSLGKFMMKKHNEKLSKDINSITLKGSQKGSDLMTPTKNKSKFRPSKKKQETQL